MLTRLLSATKPIYVQALIAIALAIALGLASPDWAQAMKPFGDVDRRL